MKLSEIQIGSKILLPQIRGEKKDGYIEQQLCTLKEIANNRATIITEDKKTIYFPANIELNLVETGDYYTLVAYLQPNS